jgi:hypothetical protein
VVALGLSVLAGLFDVVAHANRYRLFEDLASGRFVAASDGNRADSLVSASTGAVELAELLSAIAFLLWFHQAYTNTAALGHQGKYSMASAAWSWFVPIFNFFRPYQIARDMTEDAGRGLGWLLPAWWAAWIGQGAFSVIVALSSSSATIAPGQLAHRDLVSALQAAGYVLAGVLAIQVVRVVTGAQELAAATDVLDGADWPATADHHAGGT